MTKIADILQHKGSNVFSVSPGMKVYDAIAMMVDRGVGSLLVTAGDEIRGIVTERDYLGKVALEGRSSRETEVGEIMSSRLIYATPDSDVEEILAMMSEARIRHVPVMDRKQLAGIVSIGDCVKQISRDRKARIRYLTDYIHDRYPA